MYIDLSVRVGGAESVEYLNDAAATLRAVLEVRKREQLPQSWAATQLNLAIAYFQLHDWSGAAEASASVLTVDPNNKEAYGIAGLLNHDMLFNFDKALVVNQQWLALHPEDISAQANFAEAHFTVGQYAECVRRINPLLNMPEVAVGNKTALRAIEIAGLLGDSRASQVPARLDALIAEVTRQSAAFKVEWGFDGTRHFIDQTEKLSAYRAWLGQLFDALASQDRDSMLTALRNVQARFTRSSY